MIKRWSEYIEDLFHDIRGEKPTIRKYFDGPAIMKEEVYSAMRRMKKGKAIGPDEISLGMLSAAGEPGIDRLVKILNKIYDSGEIPSDLCKSIFIALPKKPGATECELHRTISLMSHVVKILLRVLISRMKRVTRHEIYADLLMIRVPEMQ